MHYYNLFVKISLYTGIILYRVIISIFFIVGTIIFADHLNPLRGHNHFVRCSREDILPLLNFKICWILKKFFFLCSEEPLGCKQTQSRTRILDGLQKWFCTTRWVSPWYLPGLKMFSIAQTATWHSFL